ncbi:MAG: TetR/AcrR family transcriptional regulator [Bacteroidetes bacterium]|nr:TetR/AcrR family transcriptional regulator [Bacteroidota bacterium]
MATESELPMDERGMRLLDEAAKVFWTYGIKSVTMDDMSARLGISKKTLYQHVKDKNDLVEKVLQCIMDRQQCAIDAVLGKGHNAIDELFDISNQLAVQLKGIHPSIHFDLEKYHPEAFRKLMNEKRTEIYSCQVANLERGIREGVYRDNFNIAMIATIYIARFDMVFDGGLFPPERFDFNEVIWELFRYHVRGIASPKGVKYLEKKVAREMRPAQTQSSK